MKRHGRLRRVAVSGLTLAAFAGALSACGSDAAEEVLRDQQLARARAEGVRQERLENRTNEAAESTKQLRREVKRLKKRGEGAAASSVRPSTGGGTTTAPSGTVCGSGLSVNSVTTCPFAANVRSAYYGSGQAATIDVFSPVTEKTYSMNCTAASPHVCTGGNNARVSFP
jgi:hypothetical protein